MEPAQLDLDWTRQHVRNNDTSTSIRAAESAQGGASHQAAAILAELATSDEPLAVEQISDRLVTMSPHQVGKRMSDLERNNLIERTKLIHRNRSGQPAFKWEAK